MIKSKLLDDSYLAAKYMAYEFKHSEQIPLSESTHWTHFTRCGLEESHKFRFTRLLGGVVAVSPLAV